MHIVIDFRWVRNRKDGIGRYLLEVTKELFQLDLKNNYTLIFFEKSLEEFVVEQLKTIQPTTIFNTYRVDYPVVSLKDFLFFRKDVKKLKPDIIFCPNYLTWPFSNEYKTFLCVPDLIPIIRRETNTTWKWRIFFWTKIFVKQIMRRADFLITISNNTKQDIIKLFKVSDKKVGVMLLGVEERFFKSIEKNRLMDIKEKYGLNSDFILCVSRQQPHKNLLGLIKAYFILPERTKKKYKLVLIGEINYFYSDTLLDKVQKMASNNLLQFTGYVDDEDLVVLYHLASLFCLPSLYEGFGLPILEALACGCPVACSRVASIPEVGGDVVTYFDPTDVLDIKNKLENELAKANHGHNFRYERIKQAKKFTWEYSAKQLLSFFINN